MLKVLSILFLFVVTTSCGPRYCDYFPYHENGRAKPVVALLPLCDMTSSGLKWDLSAELTEDLHKELMDDASLYLLADEKTHLALDHLEKKDFFDKDIQFARNFCNSEFVIAMEMIEHSYVPYERGKITPLYPMHPKDCDQVLMMKLRVRIIDVRGKPKIVLQEVIQSNHMIAKENDKIDYSICQWGSDRYTRTPLAQAHFRLAQDTALRLKKTILSAH